jgi:GTP-sensing pleiotropic transcriptional regulator CodY
MIFLTEKIRNRNRIEVFVYDSLEDLAQRVDWQDILDESLKILDEDGNLYVWDDSKRNEVGSVFSYSFKTNGTDFEFVKICKEKFNQLGQPDSFVIETHDLKATISKT